MELENLKHSTKSLKVLFVEDSLTARKTTLKMLHEFFDEVDVAEDGKSAIEKYRSLYEETDRYYDIVFSDFEMPNMDGKELSKLIMDFNPHQEIVIMSGSDDFRVIVDLINVGVKKFISKPVKMEELSETVSQVLVNIRKRQREENDRLETLEHNEYLKEKDEEYKKTLESKVKELEEFRLALDDSDIISKTDSQGNITYVNDALCRLSGYSSVELIGQNSRILNSGKRPSIFFKKMWNTINNKKIYKALFENRKKDGSMFYVETTINPIIGVDGEIREFIA
ncbi:MAG: response regulator, partial [Campylobacterota bacterium]|nr:response regulator [Campylobacterota bacterium]